ncbi:MAG: tRNA (adenosine(37)-N6)-threonylcarbamoyltransferase complex dimerization subunit type 1 TsaB [Pseudomonadota bacterium]|nr:tRNA (adenosine(37)-N6)-threonylcarbamoyltransferase complex dimerization subunit type 1 TsaB [Pseudomonadota bacterium]
MKIIALDTATESCSAALWIDGEVLERSRIDATGHSRLLLGMVEELLAEGGLALGRCDVLAVDVGPGSFTGLRIGVGAAQGLAFGAGLPVVAVPSLLALAGAAGSRNVLAAIDARMKQVYWGLFRMGADEGYRLQGEMRVDYPDDIKLTLPEDEPLLGAGSGWDSYHATLERAVNGRRVNWLPARFPQAAQVACMAAAMSREAWLPAEQAAPLYLRNQVAKIAKSSLT